MRTLKCRIIDIVIKDGARALVSIEFDDGDVTLGPWHQAFTVVPKKILTLDDLVSQLVESGIDIHRPTDPFVNLKRAMEKSVTFEIPYIPPTIEQ